jgi:MSHA biogenesis protein MshL
MLLVGQAMPVTRLAGGAPDDQRPVPPAPPPAQRPSAPGLPATQLDPGAAVTTLDSPRRLTLSFAEARPVAEVARLLVAGTPFSLAVDPEVTGEFRGELKQLTLREALTTLLAPFGYAFDARGTVIRVMRDRAETRSFDLNLLAVQRGLTRVNGPADAQVSTTLSAADVFGAVADGVQALLSPGGTVHVDPRAGLVQVTDAPDRLDRVAQYLEALEVRSGRQVRLQARVLEITPKSASTVDWRTVRAKLGVPDASSDAGLAVDPSALEAALADQGNVRLLSAPDITALNNEPALLRAGTPGVSALTMTVVPQIASDGIVQLSVSHAWEEQSGTPKAPRVSVSQADTVARVMDGNTVLIAGLLRPTDVPVTSRGMGSLFGGPAKKIVQAELVVLLRATVVTPGTHPAAARH